MAEIINNLEQAIDRIRKGAESIETANDVVLKVTEVISILSQVNDSLQISFKQAEGTSGILLKDLAEAKESLLKTQSELAGRLSSLNDLIKVTDEGNKQLDGGIAGITQLIESSQAELLTPLLNLDIELRKLKGDVVDGNECTNGVLDHQKMLSKNISGITQVIKSSQSELLTPLLSLDSELQKLLNAAIVGNQFIVSVLENQENLNASLNIQSKKMAHLEGRLETFSKVIISILIVIAGGVFANLDL